MSSPQGLGKSAFQTYITAAAITAVAGSPTGGSITHSTGPQLIYVTLNYVGDGPTVNVYLNGSLISSDALDDSEAVSGPFQLSATLPVSSSASESYTLAIVNPSGVASLAYPFTVL